MSAVPHFNFKKGKVIMAISKRDIKERVVSLAQDSYGIVLDEPTDHETMSLDDHGLDSLDTVELIMEIEEEYDIRISDDFLSSKPNLSELIDHIYDQI